MATKQDLAQSLTVSQLRELADREGVDLAGATNKSDIADRVASSVSKDTLESTASDANPTYQDATDEAAAQPAFDQGTQGTGTTDWSAPSTGANAGVEPLSNEGDVTVPLLGDEGKSLAETHPLGPPNLDPADAAAGSTPAPRNEQGAVANDPVALQKAGMSPADLEIPGLGAFGEPQIIKQNPETPVAHQVEGALTKAYGPPDATVTVTDGSGEEIAHSLDVGDRALIQQRAVASLSGHPAHTTPGHWSNPNLRGMTSEEREADAKAYADRFGG